MLWHMLSPALQPPSADFDLAQRSIFLDFDGTLVPITARPDDVVVSERTRNAVAALATAMPGRLAIVSGRTLAAIRDYFPGIPLSVAGSHGLELETIGGRRITPKRPAELDGIVDELQALADRVPGVLVESKDFGAAIHYREAPGAQPACEALAYVLADRTGFDVQPGKMVYELTLPGSDKGRAVIAMMAEAPMAGTVPVFVGDDLTDEKGFAAVRQLGGEAVLVGAERETRATSRIAAQGDVIGWLEALLERAG